MTVPSFLETDKHKLPFYLYLNFRTQSAPMSTIQAYLSPSGLTQIPEIFLKFLNISKTGNKKICTLGSCFEFGRCDDANAWRKSTKEADNTHFIAIQKVKISPCVGFITALTHAKDLVCSVEKEGFSKN